MISIELIYDLRDALKDVELGAFFGDGFLMPGGNITKLRITEVEDVKTIFIKGRASGNDGLIILTSDFEKYLPGDRITITGRVADNTSVGGWCLELRRCSPNGKETLVQHYFPGQTRMYALSYVLNASDSVRHIRLVTRPWIGRSVHTDFFVDGITITRSEGNTLADTRNFVYIMEKDRYLSELADSGYTEYMLASGNPLFAVFRDDKNNGRRSISVTCRINDWDGIDIRMSLMNLLRGNNYCVRVTGRVDGKAPPNAKMTLQLLPEYEWRGTKEVISDEKFVLEHILTPEELEISNGIRITTNSAAANMNFLVHNIEVFVVKN